METENKEGTRESRILRRIAIGFSLIVGILAVWGVPPIVLRHIADNDLEKLCNNDGGLTVKEVVPWPVDRFSPFGDPLFAEQKNLPPLKEYARPSDPFYLESDKLFIWKEGEWHPAIWRSDIRVVRASDSKVLAELISYSRVGGDPIGPWAPSTRGCPDTESVHHYLRQVFVPQK